MASKSIPTETNLPETTKRAVPNLRPWTVWGAYGLLAVALLLAAFSRGALGLKPGELALLLLAGVLVVWRLIRRDWSFPTTALDAGFLLIIVAGTILPLATMILRNIYITRDDVRALLGPVEYYLWYRVILDALPLPRELPDLSKVLLVIISFISLVGDLQIFKFPGVQKFLVHYYPTYETLQSAGFHRATSLVGGWEVLAALAAYALLLINQFQSDPAALKALGPGWNRWLLVMLGVNVVALVAALSVAGFVALTFGYALAWFLNRKLARTTLITLALGAVAALALTPYLLQRYHLQFGGATGSHSLIPQTWLERYQHWQIVVSVVFVDLPTVLFGVQPSFTYPVSEFGSTESLYLLLLYRGGLIYLLAFLVFIALVLRTVWRARADVSGFTQNLLTGLFILLVVTFVLGIIDAHFVDAGESQFLLTIIAAAAGTLLRTDRAPHRVLFANMPLPQRSIAYGGVALGLVASLAVAGLGYRLDKHLTPPPTPLSFGGPYDNLGTAWQENQHLGSAQWLLSTTNTSFLQGYAGEYSVDPGGTLPLAISSAGATAVDLSVYRLGWYYGQGGRQYASAHLDQTSQQGTWNLAANSLINCVSCQIDPQTHRVDANWKVSLQLQIGASWPSGVYLIKLSGSDNGDAAQSYIPFVVRAPASHSAVLAVLPFMAYAAENLWGGADLSTTNTADRYQDVVQPNRATQVSFNRPFADSAGAGELLNFDVHAVRWLERGGFDVTYVTDLDLAEHPEWLTQHRAVVMTGSDPYWTLAMRDGLEKARTSDVGLAFLGAQTGYWQARLGPDGSGQPDRTLICYKVQSAPGGGASMALARDPLAATQPTLATARWRDPILHRPENALLGAMYAGALDPGAPNAQGTFSGGNHPAWTASPQGPLDPMAAINTGLQPGQTVPGPLLGYGYDAIFNNQQTPAGVIILGQTTIPNPQADASAVAQTVYYRYGPGPIVFDAGTTSWDWGLDEFTFPGADLPNPLLGRQAISTLTANVLFTILPPQSNG